jgi:NADPH:quinone reductase-like Zn-dependent oxidoreductase
MLSTMQAMKAIRVHQYGGPEVLIYEDAPKPEPSAGQALVRVHATSVNPIDWKIRAGHLQAYIPMKLPIIPGLDLSGVVEALAPGVSGVSVGDDVYTRAEVSPNGSYADYIAVPASILARKPRSLDHTRAAAVPLAGLTAFQNLFGANAIALTEGQVVLIHGAAGGVGTFAVQLAHMRGARVIATGSARNEAFLRELGADEFIDYTKQRFEDKVHGVDAVLDTVGGDTLDRSWGVIKRGGVLASIAGQPSAEAAAAHGVRGHFVMTPTKKDDLDELTRLIDAGQLRPIVSEILPLPEARRAHEIGEKSHTRGKLVLQVVS